MTAVAAPVRERPILFSGEMVRAILEDRKTQTRRVVKPQPFEDQPELVLGEFHPTVIARDGTEEPGDPVYGAWNYDGDYAVRCPFGKPGDRLYVRENFSRCVCGRCDAAWPGPTPHGVDYQATYQGSSDISFRPSIHMPRWASRILLEVTEVRVERVQDISAEEVLAEGIERDDDEANAGQYWREMTGQRFVALWDSLNKSRGFGWDVNPYVWVIGFRRLHPTQRLSSTENTNG